MTLTQTALLTKKIMLFSAIALVISISGWLGYRYYYYNIYLPNLPKVEVKPEVKFGTLAKPLLPQNSFSPTNFSYVLDTPTGDLPNDLPKLMKVYFVPERSIGLMDSNRATDLALKLGFSLGPEIISPTKFRYSDSSGGQMIIDLNTGNFKFQKNVASDSASLQVGKLSSTTQIEQNFKQFLSNKGLIRKQLEGGVVKAFYNQGSQITSSNATVSIWQTDIDGFPIVSPTFNAGIIKSIVTSGQTDADRYLSLDYFYWQVEQTVLSTYPIRSVSQAFSDLKSGQGVVIMAPDNPKVSIRSVYLAYFLPDLYAQYLQPVYVFNGENFVAFVPAISPNLLEH